MSVNDSACFSLLWWSEPRKMEGKKGCGGKVCHVPVKQNTGLQWNMWPNQAFWHAKSITFIPKELCVTGSDLHIGQNRFREQQRAWVLLSELVHISMNSCSIREYVNLDNKLSCEKWIFSDREMFLLLFILESCLLNICWNLTCRL